MDVGVEGLEEEFGTGYAGISLGNSAYESREGFRVRTDGSGVLRSTLVHGMLTRCCTRGRWNWDLNRLPNSELVTVRCGHSYCGSETRGSHCLWAG